MILTAEELIEIKSKVKTEFARRNAGGLNYGDVSGFSKNTYDFADPPQNGIPIQNEYYQKIYDPLLNINDFRQDNELYEKNSVRPATKVDDALEYVNKLSTVPMDTTEAIASGCRGACSGLCAGSCAGQCIGCSGTATSGNVVSTLALTENNEVVNSSFISHIDPNPSLLTSSLDLPEEKYIENKYVNTLEDEGYILNQKVSTVSDCGTMCTSSCFGLCSYQCSGSCLSGSTYSNTINKWSGKKKMDRSDTPMLMCGGCNSDCISCAAAGNCANTCGGDCTGCTSCISCAAAGNCSGTCGGDCTAYCANHCVSRCDGACLGGCASGCTSCLGTCRGGCEKTCSGCEGTCTGRCDSCTGTCTGSCTSCSGTCSGSCSGCTGCTSCSGTCKNSCNGCTGCTSCSGTCQGTCKDTCKSGCSSGCQSECQKSCLSTCSTTCLTSCQGTCFGQVTSPVN